MTLSLTRALSRKGHHVTKVKLGDKKNDSTPRWNDKNIYYMRTEIINLFLNKPSKLNTI
jgi:hypothetical protein